MILRQFDFIKLHPLVVLFECKHLTSSDKLAARKLMENHGYLVFLYETDFLCLG